MKKLLGCFLCLMLMFFLAAPAAAVGMYDTLLDAVDSNNSTDYPYSGLGDAQVLSWLEGIIGDTTVQVGSTATILAGATAFDWEYAVVHTGGGPGVLDIFAYKDDALPAAGDNILQAQQYPYPNGVSFVRYYGSQSVPEPAILLLLGSGLVGLAMFGRKRFKK